MNRPAAAAPALVNRVRRTSRTIAAASALVTEPMRPLAILAAAVALSGCTVEVSPYMVADGDVEAGGRITLTRHAPPAAPADGRAPSRT
jgi:2-keto-4-pentenoate hydratase